MADIFDDIRMKDDRDGDEPALIVDVEGFEGPLDLLLELARRQKVDLLQISVLQLAEQYLSFVEVARRIRLELAADYLVMAAWLAYLKSRLLLPISKTKDEPSAEDMAAALARRLQKMEIIRRVAERLSDRHLAAQESFTRGAPEAVAVVPQKEFTATLYDLLAAYARQRQIQARSRVTIAKRFVWSLQEAREALQRLIGDFADWTPIDDFLIQFAIDPTRARSMRASSFAATLELVKDGGLDVRQDAPFAPLMLRKRRNLQLAAG